MWYEIISKFEENSAHLGIDGYIAVFIGIIVLTIVLCILGNTRIKNLPPGPLGLPVFGYYFFLGKKPGKTLHNLAKRYGNVIGFHIGPQYIVVLNDWDAMTDAYSQNATLDRPSLIFAKVPYNFGVGGVNGEEWVQARRLSSRAMKDVGVQNTVWEQIIQDEVTDLVQKITREGDRPVNVRSLFRNSFANNMVSLILGKRLHPDHPFTKFVANMVDAFMECNSTLGMMNYSVTLAKILQVMGIEKEMPLGENWEEFSKIISQTVDKVILNPDSEKEDSFILRFQEQINNHRKNKNTLITEDTIKGTVIVLLAGGSETSRCTIIWTLIAMAENQDKQRKVHEELDKVLGKDGSIRWPERLKIPFTYASLLESMRWATVVPISTLRITNKDIDVQGYHIPKGTYLSTNIYALHNDERYWKEPDRFVPERFLLDDERIVNSAPDSFDPFSYGRRVCPGKLMASMELLQCFTILMQNFKVIPKEGNTVNYKEELGLTNQATDFELRFIPR